LPLLFKFAFEKGITGFQLNQVTWN